MTPGSGDNGKDLVPVGLNAWITLLDDTAGEVGDGPEQEQNGQAARDSAHEIDPVGGGMGIVTEQDDKETAQEDEQGGSRRVGGSAACSSWR